MDREGYRPWTALAALFATGCGLIVGITDTVEQTPAAVSSDGGSSSGPCPPGAKTLGSHCYWATAPMTQVEAKEACRKEGGYLATLADADESKLVASLVRDADIWIGFEAPSEGAKFAWITNEPVTIELWKSGEPSGSGTCSVIVDSTNTWADQICADKLPGGCERP